MKERIMTGIVLILLLGPTIFLGGWVFNLMIAFLCLVGATEILRMAKISRISFPSMVTYIALLSIIFHDQLINYLPNNISDLTVPLVSIMVLLLSTVIVKGYEFTKAGISVLTIFYLGLGGYAAVNIRETNLAFFLYLLIIVLSTDIGAYFIGSQFGKHKLAPVLSPNKTIEGSIGGMLTAFILTAIYLNFISFTYSYSMMLFLSLVLSITGQFGDLIASRLKRHFQVKDAGNIFPGHGGVLDRFDSVLFTLAMTMVLGII